MLMKNRYQTYTFVALAEAQCQLDFAAEEGIDVPNERFSPWLGVSVRGLRGGRCGGSAMAFELGLKKGSRGFGLAATRHQTTLEMKESSE